MASPRALRVLNTRAGWPAGAREAATGAEEVAAFDDAGAGDARHLGSSHPISMLLDAPDEALNVPIASARGGGKMLAVGTKPSTPEPSSSRRVRLARNWRVLARPKSVRFIAQAWRTLRDHSDRCGVSPPHRLSLSLSLCLSFSRLVRRPPSQRAAVLARCLPLMARACEASNLEQALERYASPWLLA